MSYPIYDFSQSYHSVLLEKNTRNIYSFGKNNNGQLGLGDNINRNVPTLLNFEFDGNIINISLGEHHSMVLTDTNKIYSFGHNSYGQLGQGDNSNKYVPTLINFQFDGNPIKIQQGNYHSLVLTNINKIYSFGWNDRGQLGLGDNINRNIPTLINYSFDGTPIEIFSGNYHSFILTDTNKIYSFGWNNYGQLGIGNTANKNIPTLLNFQFDGIPIEIQQGIYHSMILTNTNKIYSFGHNGYGQLGLGHNTNKNIPTLINYQFDGNPIKIQLGENHSLILTDNNKVYIFGQNNYGQLGLGDLTNKNTPTLINYQFDGNIVDIKQGDFHTLIITDKNKIYSFGQNNYGQLGLGDNNSRNTPTLIPNFEILTPYILILLQNLSEAGTIQVNSQDITTPYSKSFEQNSNINVKQISNNKYEFVRWIIGDCED